MYSPYSVADIKRVCAEHRIRPSKDRGQNFLIDEHIADAVIAAAQVPRHHTVIEVGPGLGALTFKLAAHAQAVKALEIDQRMAQVLGEELKERHVSAVEVIEGDALAWLRERDISKFRNASPRSEPRGSTTGVDLSIVSSLPYSITSDFFSTVLADDRLPLSLTLVVQREVAVRLAARPPHMSMLSVVAQWFGEVTVLQRIPRSAFWPEPQVESALVHIATMSRHTLRRRKGIESGQFFSFVRRAFKHPRKKIGNTLGLSPARGWSASGGKRLNFDISRRPEDLTVDDWIALFRAIILKDGSARCFLPML